MSIYGGPDIVTDGLVLHLDAANRKSYPGSGSTWYDLSGNGYNGILHNGPIFSSANNGVFTFDGVNDRIDIGSIDLRYVDYTIMGASRYVSVNTGTTHGGGRIISGASTNFLLGHWERSANKHYAGGWVSNSSGTEYNGDLTWKIYTASRKQSTDQAKFYSNDTLVVNNSTAASYGPLGFSLGRYQIGNSEYSNGQISFLIAYNRVLTDSEVRHNYNALKGRYGLT